jgi:hypothetical protein
MNDFFNGETRSFYQQTDELCWMGQTNTTPSNKLVPLPANDESKKDHNQRGKEAAP